MVKFGGITTVLHWYNNGNQWYYQCFTTGIHCLTIGYTLVSTDNTDTSANSRDIFYRTVLTCFTLVVFLMSGDCLCSVTLPHKHVNVSKSAVCDSIFPSHAHILT